MINRNTGPLTRNQQPSARHQLLHVTPEPHSSRRFTSSSKGNLFPLILYGSREIDGSAAGAGPKSGHLVIFGTRFIPPHGSTCCDRKALVWNQCSRCFFREADFLSIRCFFGQMLPRVTDVSTRNCWRAESCCWRLVKVRSHDASVLRILAPPLLQDLQVRVHLQPSDLHLHPTETLTGF